MPSVVEETPYNEYDGNGVATVYPYTFTLLEEGDLVVTIDGVVIPASDFTLSGLGVQGGGNITFDAAPADETVILISRDIALERTTEYQFNGPRRADTLNADFNRLWQALQGIAAYIGGSLRLPYPEQADELPPADERKGFLLGFDSITGAVTLVTAAVGSAVELALQLASSAGASIVGFVQSVTGSVTRTVQAKLRESYSLGDFGAVGDGTTDDTTAILTALARVPAGATLTLIGTSGGDVFHTTGISASRSNLTIRGIRKPKTNTAFEALEGGTIIRGTFLLEGDNLSLEDFGVDRGITYSDAHKGGAGGDGLVVHDIDLSQVRRNIRVNRVIGMTRVGDYLDPTAAYHAVLLEGLENGSSNDVTGVGGWFGVVLKVANWTFNGLTAIENDAAGVYIKSNSYGPVANVVGNNVVVIAGSSRAHRGFLVSASDAELANVAVHGVTVIGGAGGGGVVIEGEATQPAVDVVITGISTRSTGNGVAAIGPVYASSMQGTIDKPSSAVCLQVAANGSAVQPNDIELDLRVNIDGSLSASTTTAITAANAKVFLKRFHATYSYSEPALVTATANTKIGDFFGRLLSDRTEANLQNGWAVSTGGNKCGMHTRFGVTSGYGRIIYSGASSDTFFTLSAGAFPGLTQLIPALGFDGLTGEPATVYVQVSSGGVMSIYPNRASYAANLSYIDLSSVRFNAQLPTTGPL